MFEIYTRSPKTGLLHRDVPVLPYRTRKVAEKEARKLTRAGFEVHVLPTPSEVAA